MRLSSYALHAQLVDQAQEESSERTKRMLIRTFSAGEEHGRRKGRTEWATTTVVTGICCFIAGMVVTFAFAPMIFRFIQ